MRLAAITANNVRPIKRFSVDNLSDIVVIAGQNGVGKTRLLNALLQHLQNPTAKNQGITVRFEATSDDERAAWGKEFLDTAITHDAQRLFQTFQQNKSKRKWTSSLVNIESNRSVTRMDPLPFTFDVISPYDETAQWNSSFTPLHGRFSSTKQDIFKLIIAQRNAIANRAVQLRAAGKSEMSLDFGDPLQRFRDAAEQLLSPKLFAEARIRDQALLFADTDGTFGYEDLSSGEREVVTIVFDFILRSPSHCVVIFDEPELHLHPELALKLVRTLRTVGESNQFVFSTHSADLISASLENTVVFVKSPHNDENQAVLVDAQDETHEALQLIGQSIGIVSLGKNIVLIEGDQSALDKQTYGSIVGRQYPDLVLVPSGGRDTIVSFSTIYDQVLSKSMWGINFFMLCDNDSGIDETTVPAIPPGSIEATRLRFLSRYHLENYFLDVTNIVAALKSILPVGNAYLDSEHVQSRLLELAGQNIAYATALKTARHFRLLAGNLSLNPKAIDGCSLDELSEKILEKARSERTRVTQAVSDEDVLAFCATTYREVRKSLDIDNWRIVIPCRRVVPKFCAELQLKSGHFKKLYIDAALETNSNAFEEIFAIFDSFASHSANSAPPPMQP